MKNNITSLVYALLTVIFITLTACKDTQNTLEDKGLTLVLSKVENLAKAEKNIILFDIVFDEGSGQYRSTGFKTVVHGKKIVDFVKGGDPEFNYMENPFQIVCTDTEGNRSVVTCPDRLCVANAIAVCLEEGSKTTLFYYPPDIE